MASISHKAIETVLENIVTSNFDNEMGVANDTVDGMRMTLGRIQNASQAGKYGLVEGLMSIPFKYNPLQLTLLVRIEDPWVVVQCEEGVRIEVTVVLFSFVPFLQENDHLLFEINILIDGFVVEF